jgi:hypothetical protein
MRMRLGGGLGEKKDEKESMRAPRKDARERLGLILVVRGRCCTVGGTVQTYLGMIPALHFHALGGFVERKFGKAANRYIYARLCFLR